LNTFILNNVLLEKLVRCTPTLFQKDNTIITRKLDYLQNLDHDLSYNKDLVHIKDNYCK